MSEHLPNSISTLPVPAPHVKPGDQIVVGLPEGTEPRMVDAYLTHHNAVPELELRYWPGRARRTPEQVAHNLILTVTGVGQHEDRVTLTASAATIDGTGRVQLTTATWYVAEYHTVEVIAQPVPEGD